MLKKLLILLNINDVCHPNGSDDTRLQQVKNCLNQYFKLACANQTSDIQIESIIWGKDNKALICETANHWNMEIFDAIAQGASPSVINPETKQSVKISSSNQLAYQALKAFLQTGVPFYSWGERFLFNMVVLVDNNNNIIDEFGHIVDDINNNLFQTILEPSQMQHIIDFPHQYAMANIVVELPEAAV